ncbi:hypothetical protein M2352_000415 [Azospirillum fermentarium]|uniref:hypothetical protein n=1 Tax=Azospirillum fermentarium TaxID=1233114 RepID=UPI0022279F9B|nr:hypothetical protein [Azospirillum fermentarium]MCW2244824.1 hypothetical protein [Azospirillum fermentarium]
MKELRCLVFKDQEVMKAVTERRRRRGDPMPAESVTAVSYLTGDGGVLTCLHLDGGETLVLPADEVLGALVSHCKNRHVPLPADSDKSLYVIRGTLALMITINFNKPVRMIPIDAHAAGSTVPPAPQPRRRMVA